jgi:hypothetical protein
MKTILVTNCDWHNWKIDPKSLGKINTSPLIDGLEFKPIEKDKHYKIRLAGYENHSLNHITELKYSTFTDHDDKLVPGLVLQVQYRNRSSGLEKEKEFIFEPRLQDGSIYHNPDYTQNIIKGMWQEWDLLKGVWWMPSDDLDNFRDPFTAPPALSYTFKSFLREHHDVTLIKDPLLFGGGGAEGDAIRLTVGDPYNDWPATLADNFIIGINSLESKQYIFRYSTKCLKKGLGYTISNFFLWLGLGILTKFSRRPVNPHGPDIK